METWAAMFVRAGFGEVSATAIVAEAGLVTGRRPDHPDTRGKMP